MMLLMLLPFFIGRQSRWPLRLWHNLSRSVLKYHMGHSHRGCARNITSRSEISDGIETREFQNAHIRIRSKKLRTAEEEIAATDAASKDTPGIASNKIISPKPYQSPNSLLMLHLRLACICRQRMMRNLAFDRHGCVAIVEEVSW